MKQLTKIISLLLLIITISNITYSQVVVPEGILFQAVARDANNNAASNRNIYVQIAIKRSNPTGTTDYAESFKVVSSQEGIFSIVIGQGVRTAGVSTIKSLDWSKYIYFVNLRIAIEPTLPDPSWTATNNYVDIGTSQLWTVPYSFTSNNSIFSDSASTISGILTSNKGGTGVNNNGKTITIANNIITKGVGDLTITTTAASNVTFPASGTISTLAGTETITNKTIISPIITGRPLTVTQDSTVADSTIATTLFVSKQIKNLKLTADTNSNKKLNISDTLVMLSNRIARDTMSLSNRIIRDSILITKNKQAIIDTAAAIKLLLSNKVDTSQFPNLIKPFLANTIYSFNDTLTLSNRINTKLNISDTSGMLSSRIGRDTIALSNRINTKLNISDTSAMLSNRIGRDTVALSNRINTKLNISDTSAMLSNRIGRDTISLSNRIGRDSILITKNKQGIIDTAAAIRLKLNDKIEASQFPNLIQPFLANTIFSFNDTMTLSNRINTKLNKADTAALSTWKLNKADTAAMLTNYARKFTQDYKVKIAPGKYLGKYISGDSVHSKGMTLDQFLSDIITEVVHPTYVLPTVTLTSPTATDYEIGSNISSINLTKNFIQNDAGAIVTTTFKKNGVSLAGASDNISNLTTDQIYTVQIDYAAGAIKLNNLEQSDPVGSISAGSISSAGITLSVKSKRFWGTSSTTNPTDLEIQNAMNEFTTSREKSTFSISVSSGPKYLFYAYPAGYLNLSSLSVGGFESISAFTPITRTFINARGYSSSYIIYVSNNNFLSSVDNINCK